jgi:hypothetical protein
MAHLPSILHQNRAEDSSGGGQGVGLAGYPRPTTPRSNRLLCKSQGFSLPFRASSTAKARLNSAPL